MYEIEITDQQSLLNLDNEQLIDTARMLLTAEQVKSATLSLVFVEDGEIHQINRDFLQHDYPTDVISFLLNQRQNSSLSDTPDSPRGVGQHLEGEIIISTETAIRESRDYNWSPGKETLLYLIHGLLHLAGYDDLTDDDCALMRRREKEILELCGLEFYKPKMDEPPGESIGQESPPVQEDSHS